MNGTLTEVKNTLQGIDGGVEQTEDQIVVLEDKGAEDMQTEQQKEKGVKAKQRKAPLRQLHAHQHSRRGVMEGEGRERGIENLCKKVVIENFPHLVKETDTQVQEAQRAQNKVNPKKPIASHIIIKMPKVK